MKHKTFVQKMRGILNSLTEFQHSSKRAILLLTITVVITLIIGSVISAWLSKVTNLSIPSLGTIKTLGVEVYWDKNLKNKTKAIDWGTIWLGTTKNVTLYIKSVSNVPTTLQLETANWTFLDSNNNVVSGPNKTTSYIDLTWNYKNATIQPGEITQITLTLLIDSSNDFIQFLITNDVKKFNFDIIIKTVGDVG
jgi:hypothetical protein